MTADRLNHLLAAFPSLSLAVVGDFFLDKYLVIDRALSETSLETGKECYQVVAIRHSPGAAGTVCNNLTALGVGTLYAVGLTGDDGQGYELRQDLAGQGVRLDYLRTAPGFFTPTYTKPMERRPDGSEEEMERVDLKNRRPLAPEAEQEMLACLQAVAGQVDGIIVADQVQERNHGIVTDALREALSRLASAHPELVLLADSRVRIGEFRGVALKPNQHEARAALGRPDSGEISLEQAEEAGRELCRRAERPVFLTRGAEGILVCAGKQVTPVPGVPVSGPLDIVGAGDSATAGIMLGLCAGATPAEAAVVGNLVASITVQQVGTTGTASPAQVRERFAQVAERFAEV